MTTIEKPSTPSLYCVTIPASLVKHQKQPADPFSDEQTSVHKLEFGSDAHWSATQKTPWQPGTQKQYTWEYVVIDQEPEAIFENMVSNIGDSQNDWNELVECFNNGTWLPLDLNPLL